MKIAYSKVTRLAHLLMATVLFSPAFIARAQEAKDNDSSKLSTRIFQVRPDFLNLPATPFRQIEGDDPFSDEPAAVLQESLQGFFEKQGLTFPTGASVSFNGVTSQLIIRNTRNNIDKVIALIKSTKAPSKDPKDITDEKGLRAIVELIEINQGTAATLLHQHMASNNATALRTTLEEWIKEGKASISQSSFLRTRLGNSKVESTGENQHPKTWSSPNSDKDGSKAPYTTHRSPAQFETTKLGLTVELNTAPHGEAEGETAGIKWTIQSTELLGKIGYGTGVSEIEKPLFYRQELVTELPLQSGQWQLLGTFSPAQAEDNARTLVLVRAESGARDTNLPSLDDTTDHPTTISALMEYIEVDATDATNFTLKHSGVDGTQFLEAATAWINEGRARRVETVYLSSQQGDGYASGSVQSVREIVYPSEWESPNIIGSKITGVIPDKTNLVVPAAATEFETQLVGTMLDLHPTRRLIAGGDVTIRYELKSLAGFDSYGREESEVTLPLISNLEVAAQERSMKELETDGTELLSMQIPLRADTHRHDTSRRILVFLTTAVQNP